RGIRTASLNNTARTPLEAEFHRFHPLRMPLQVVAARTTNFGIQLQYEVDHSIRTSVRQIPCINRRASSATIVPTRARDLPKCGRGFDHDMWLNRFSAEHFGRALGRLLASGTQKHYRPQGRRTIFVIFVCAERTLTRQCNGPVAKGTV